MSYDDGPSDDPTIEHLCHLLAVMFYVVNPAINEDATYDLLLDMFEKDLSVRLVESYGMLIRATAASPHSEEFH